MITNYEFCVVQDEILEVAGKIYKAGMSLLVIDTENKFVSTGFAKEIARVAQGLVSLQLILRYLYVIFKQIIITLCALFVLPDRKILLLAKCFGCCYLGHHKGCTI